jgi:hypothetical protein
MVTGTNVRPNDEQERRGRGVIDRVQSEHAESLARELVTNTSADHL